jgi:hypothetical protein
MSDEVRLTGNIGRGVGKQTGSFPRPRRGKKEKEDKAPKTTNKKELVEKPKTQNKSGSKSKSDKAHSDEPIKVSSERIYPKGPEELSGGSKALTPPPQKSLDKPGPFVATPVVDLNEGPNFGKVGNDISRQFRK